MSKTLEEMAADAAAEWIKNSTTNHSLADACALYGYNVGFLAGYKAAQAIVEDELSSDWDWTDDVTHWQELPEPPKEEE
jgi:hypothetical protein